MRITKSEREILETLWACGEPLSLTQLITASPERGWKDRSAFAFLSTLLKKELIHEAGFIHSGKAIARVFAPTVTKAEYLAGQIIEDETRPTLPSLVTALLGQQTVSLETLAELEQIIAEKKSEIQNK